MHNFKDGKGLVSHLCEKCINKLHYRASLGALAGARGMSTTVSIKDELSQKSLVR